jgi:hypothetical protein
VAELYLKVLLCDITTPVMQTWRGDKVAVTLITVTRCLPTAHPMAGDCR